MNLAQIKNSITAIVQPFNEYFTKAQIYGVDPMDFGAKENCAKFPRINITYADGYRREFAETLSNFDIIIDDGPHTRESHYNHCQSICPN